MIALAGMPPLISRVFCGCLDYDRFTALTGIMWVTAHNHAELGRHDVQLFTDVFDNDMTLSTAATGNLWCKDLLAARQVLRQDAACGT
jgi:hypothetical protein